MSTQMPHIEPTVHQLKDLTAAAHESEGPVVMINLLRFRQQDGRDGYQRYAQEVQPHLERVGARVLYTGDSVQVVIGADDQAWWDAIVVVKYPSRASFLEMISDPGYQAVAVHRAAALETSSLIATDPWPARSERAGTSR